MSAYIFDETFWSLEFKFTSNLNIFRGWSKKKKKNILGKCKKKWNGGKVERWS